jgi:dephospho-CoA kinase
MDKLAKSVGILIMGPMRAGKTTAAGYFREKYGIPRHSLADKLKELYVETTGSYDKDREWLQNTGEAHRRVFGEDFWAEELCSSLTDESVQSFVIDDIRYPNEFNMLYDYATRRCDIVIPLFIRVSLENIIVRGGETELLSHESELFARRIQNEVKNIGSESYEYVTVEGEDVHVLDGNASLRDFFWQLHNEVQLPVKDKTPTVDTYEVDDG